MEEWELQDGGGATHRPSDIGAGKEGGRGGNSTHLENENNVKRPVL